MQSQIENPMDEATYARLAEQSETRLEWIGGQIVAMAGASVTHAKIAGRIAAAINNGLEGEKCEAVTSDIRIHVAATAENFYPDVVLVCDDTQYHETLFQTLLTPLLAVEVLSPSTQNYDLDEKLTAYQSIPSLQHYLIVWQDRVQVRHYARADDSRWDYRAYVWRRENIHLDSLDVSIALETIYRNLNVPEGLTLVPRTQI